jgi:hypothetical protein
MGQRVVGISSLCVVLVFVLATERPASAQEKKDTKPKVEQAIGIWTPPYESWLLIFSDGSGRLGYGAGGTPDTNRPIPAGTFDVVQVTKDLRGLKADIKDWQKARYGFNFESERKGPEQPGPTYFTQDQKVIPALFEKAAKASARK